MLFEFATAGRIVFGRGSAGSVGAEAAALGRKALVLTGRTSERWDFLWKDLQGRGLDWQAFAIPHEPTVALVEQAVQAAGRMGADLVIGIGGGSVIDAAKAVAAKLPNPGDLMDYLEVIGRGRALSSPSLPCIAVPTTAGTGAEVTRNAVLRSGAHGVKVSLRSATMLPERAIVDPDLTLRLPPEITAGTGLDALTQLLEAFVSRRANPLTDGLCREGLRRAARSLEKAFTHGEDGAAREDMALASLFGGLALANAGLGAVHGFAGPLGGMVSAPHGMICAALLPQVMAANIRALEGRDPVHPALNRYAETAALLTGRAGTTAADGVAWVERLVARLGVPTLGRMGFSAGQIEEAVSKARQASSMKGNPVTLTEAALMGIYRRSL
jgi:alcohol dehydrogenase class IV